MLDWLLLIPALPLAGFVLLVVLRGLPARLAGLIGTLTVGASAVLAIWAGVDFFTMQHGHPISKVLWEWMPLNAFDGSVTIGWYLDSLSLVMMVVVTFVGFWIHLYSTAFMAGDEGYRRYFAYMNLFVASMLVLVLADNLLLLYLGWEGVGLCSYLLIGFWYREPANGRAAMKAFIVTRIGDASLGVGLFLLLANLGTLDIQEMMRRAVEQWPVGSGLAVAAAALLLGGAVGKSAQLPLQTWLPDAMAGPSPVSALIHAATMVTAGVYLLARTNVLLTLAPSVQAVVAILGAATLLLAGLCALCQTDIKRVLAYSTISQIGYMFLALGVGAYGAAMFHFMTHAFFKSLLFLAAGVVILAMHEEHNMFKMGGLWRKMPLTFVTFLAGACSLSALPLVTAGFYSKDLILQETYTSAQGGQILYAAGLAGAFLTALYTFRMVFVTFFGPVQKQPVRSAGLRMGLALVVLAVMSIVGGVVEMPQSLYHVTLFTSFVQLSVPAPAERLAQPPEHMLMAASSLVTLAGILVAWVFYAKAPSAGRALASAPAGNALRRWLLAGAGFDWLYDRLIVRPFVWAARVNRDDFVDLLYRAIARVCGVLNALLSRTQTGTVRWYAAGLAFGAIVILAILVLL